MFYFVCKNYRKKRPKFSVSTLSPPSFSEGRGEGGGGRGERGGGEGAAVHRLNFNELGETN